MQTAEVRTGQVWQPCGQTVAHGPQPQNQSSTMLCDPPVLYTWRVVIIRQGVHGLYHVTVAVMTVKIVIFSM
jgi:hypothetical protein